MRRREWKKRIQVQLKHVAQYQYLCIGLVKFKQKDDLYTKFLKNCAQLQVLLEVYFKVIETFHIYKYWCCLSDLVRYYPFIFILPKNTLKLDPFPMIKKYKDRWADKK